MKRALSERKEGGAERPESPNCDVWEEIQGLEDTAIMILEPLVSGKYSPAERERGIGLTNTLRLTSLAGERGIME